MEVGAVKQAFNNELIVLKKNLNQAKINVIHKLTRKAKTFAEKKVPEPLKEKLRRKAESAVREVLIIKKIKPKDIGKFIVTHKGQLQEFLNKPQVDNDKACARLLLHKSMQDKYMFIRNRFSNVPIKDLFMSRQERLKLKKEARESQKKKKDKKGKNSKIVNAEGDWDVEDIGSNHSKELSDQDNGENRESNDENVSLDDEVEKSDLESEDHDSKLENNRKLGQKRKENNSDLESEADSNSDVESTSRQTLIDNEFSVSEHSDDNELTGVIQFVRPPKKALKHSVSKPPSMAKVDLKDKTIKKAIKKNLEKKQKDNNKNKNLKEKLLSRKFKKDSDDLLKQESKVIDPFFITATGENYMSVAEPRQPDEIKEVHKQGNRKMRRAIMHGHVPKSKPRNVNFRQGNDRFDRNNEFNRSNKSGNQNGFDRNNSRFNKNADDIPDGRKAAGWIDRSSASLKPEDKKPEKLHPSWEAKKKQSGIQPFKGKKIVFDES